MFTVLKTVFTFIAYGRAFQVMESAIHIYLGIAVETSEKPEERNSLG